MTSAAPVHGILILGAAKSGTTALFYAIKQSLAARGQPVEGLFEPTATAAIMRYARDGSDAVPLVKMLLGPFLRTERARRERVLATFNRSIVIFRDPRDNIVSRIVFFLTKFIDARDTQRIEAAVEVFRQKEQDPNAISIVGMVKRLMEITGQPGLLENMRLNAVVAASLKKQDPRHFMMPYEDLVSKRFDDLEAYLGFPIIREFEVEKKHSYVVRTKGAGNWKDWFLPEDVEFFVKPVADEFRTLGYDPDEAPGTDKQIDPASCSAYVVAQFQKQLQKRDERQPAKRELQAKAGSEPADAAETEAERERRRARRRQKMERRAAEPPSPAAQP